MTDQRISLVSAFGRAAMLVLAAVVLMACSGVPEPFPTPTSDSPQYANSYGDDATLDSIWDDCASGETESCRALVEAADAGTDYWVFGETCGNTVEAGGCPKGSDIVPPATTSLSWGEQAEAACRDVESGMGSAPSSQSGNVDDDMALYYDWHAGVIDDAVAQLGDLDALDPTATDFVSGLSYVAELENAAARLYAEHYVYSDKLNQIQADLAEATAALVDAAGAVGAPACADLLQ